MKIKDLHLNLTTIGLEEYVKKLDEITKSIEVTNALIDQLKKINIEVVIEEPSSSKIYQ